MYHSWKLTQNSQLCEGRKGWVDPQFQIDKATQPEMNESKNLWVLKFFLSNDNNNWLNTTIQNVGSDPHRIAR